MHTDIQTSDPASPSRRTRQAAGEGSDRGDRRHSRRLADHLNYPRGTSVSDDSGSAFDIPIPSAMPSPPAAGIDAARPSPPSDGGPRQPLVFADAVEHGTTGRDVTLIFIVVGLIAFVVSTFEPVPW